MLFSIKQGGGGGVMENSIKNNAVIFGNLPLAFYFFISKYISKKVSLLSVAFKLLNSLCVGWLGWVVPVTEA